MPAQAEVRARIDRFVSDLAALIRSTTVEAFEEALAAQRAAIGTTARKKRDNPTARKRATSARSNADNAAPTQLSLPLE
jgi:hypothetical protein